MGCATALALSPSSAPGSGGPPRSPRTGCMLICIGVLSMLVFQIFQNVGMTMGIMPITGITLPFMSYGGSSAIASWLAVGLVLNVHMRRFGRAGAAARRTRGARARPRPAGFGARSDVPLALSRHVICVDATRAPSGGGGQAGPVHRARARRAASRGGGGGGVVAAHLPRHLRDRAPQPGPADPLRDPQRAPRRHRRAVLPRSPGATWRRCSAERIPLFSVDTHRPAHEFDVLAFNLSAELTYTTCSTASTWPGPGARRAPPRAPAGGGGRALHLQPRAAGRLPRLRGPRRRRGGRVRDHGGGPWKASGRTESSREAVLRSCPSRGRVRPLDVRGRLRGPAHPGGHAPLPRRPRAGREAHDRRPRRLAYPAASSSRSPRWSTTGSTSRCSGLHPGLPVLPGGHDHPPGPGAPRRPGPHRWSARACAAPATTRWR